MKPVIDINKPEDTEAQGQGAERIRETRKALYDLFPISPADLDYESTADYWPAGSLTGGFDPKVEDGSQPPHPQMQDKAFLVGNKKLNYDYTIPAGKNAIAPGPLDVGSTTLDIPEGATLTIVGDTDNIPVYLRDMVDVDAGSFVTDQYALIWQQEHQLWYPGPAPKGDQGNTGNPGTDGAEGEQGPEGHQGADGIEGPQGPKGDEGAKGFPGNIGPEGPQGEEGPPGLPGLGINLIGSVDSKESLPGWPDYYEGAVGNAYITDDTGDLWSWGSDSRWYDLGHIVGPEGPKGDPGIQGERGAEGIDGEDGAQGIQGQDGGEGPRGADGPPGIDSTVPGPEGPEGPKGEHGADSMVPGPEGPTGPEGADGAQGERGFTGDDGADGATGNTGPAGDAGLTGPEGPIGPKGNEGDQGPQGDQGMNLHLLGTVASREDLPGWPDSYEGVVGDSYETMNTGDLWSWADDSTWHDVGHVQGPTGLKGDTGPQGPIGPVGETGETGGQGIQGVIGPQGPIGPIGNTGDQGPDGATGSTGEAGATGPQGERGNTGETGPQGPIGYPGEDSTVAGPDGEQGIQGIPGPTGDTGDQGPQGESGDNSTVPGPPGPPGTGIQVIGSVDTWAQLPDSGNTVGDAYLTSDTGDVWVWSEDGTWHDLGHIVGPPGEDGHIGVDGEPGPPGEDGLIDPTQDYEVTGKWTFADTRPVIFSPSHTSEAVIIGSDSGNDLQISGLSTNGFMVNGSRVWWGGNLPNPTSAERNETISGNWDFTNPAQTYAGDGSKLTGIVQEEGPTGPQGIPGTPGVKGNTGDTGPKGDDGSRGPQGEQGIPGPDGSQGPGGPKGDSGIQGIPGEDSDVPGPQGEQGVGIHIMGSIPAANGETLPPDYDGVIGDAWLATDSGDLWVWSDDGTWHNLGHIVGPEGEQGDKGNQGNPGVQGEIGNTGPQGGEGPVGAKGETGNEGPTGKEGEKGTTGNDGPKGAGWTQGYYTASDGIVTFVSVDGLGFKTSDIRGEQGERGPDGPQGGTGQTGGQGPEGDQGIDGPQGIQGIPGPQGIGIHFHDAVATKEDLPGWPDQYGGDEGDAYMTTDTGDLWVWSASSTWVDMGHVVGPEGPEGPTGAQGPIGPKGEEGEHGEHGEHGVDGLTGPPGEKGEPGIAGNDGLSGSDGADGQQGLPGAHGADGADGATGAPGQDSTVPGPPGEPGIEGPAGDLDPNSILPSHLNVPGTLRGQGLYQLIDGEDSKTYVMTDDDGDEYVYSAESRVGVAYINDLADVGSVNRKIGSTMAWDGFQYISALYPDEGIQGPEGEEGPIGPDGLKGPRGEEGPVGPPGPQGPEGGIGIPAGGIIMWSGSLVEIPPTWLLCNGTEGTPDLRDRFIMGAGHKDIGQTGGGTSDGWAITSAQMPSHKHSFTGSGSTDNGGSHNHTMDGAGSHSHNILADKAITTATTRVKLQTGNYEVSVVSGHGTWKHEGAHTHYVNWNDKHAHSVDVSGWTQGMGSGSAHSHTGIVPLYYTLAYIMKEYT